MNLNGYSLEARLKAAVISVLQTSFKHAGERCDGLILLISTVIYLNG